MIPRMRCRPIAVRPAMLRPAMDRIAAARSFFGTTAIADAPTEEDRLPTAENWTSLDTSGSTNFRQSARVRVPISVWGHGWDHRCEVGDISQLFQFTNYRVHEPCNRTISEKVPENQSFKQQPHAGCRTRVSHNTSFAQGLSLSNSCENERSKCRTDGLPAFGVEERCIGTGTGTGAR